ncbi:peroxidase [Salvia divinorum]|uniref:Peroxidase n=1 Tax=Salvia divinorum TaxID=28513 RepID=A0ABD1FX55_SALDI
MKYLLILWQRLRFCNPLDHRSIHPVNLTDNIAPQNYNTSQLALEYAAMLQHLKQQFSLSISRLGGLKVLTGNQGEIRLNCRFTNKNNPYT